MVAGQPAAKMSFQCLVWFCSDIVCVSKRIMLDSLGIASDTKDYDTDTTYQNSLSFWGLQGTGEGLVQLTVARVVAGKPGKMENEV